MKFGSTKQAWTAPCRPRARTHFPWLCQQSRRWPSRNAWSGLRSCWSEAQRSSCWKSDTPTRQPRQQPRTRSSRDDHPSSAASIPGRVPRRGVLRGPRRRWGCPDLRLPIIVLARVMQTRYSGHEGRKRGVAVKTEAQRFAEKVILPTEPNGCWGWRGSVQQPNKLHPKRNLPYALFRSGGRMAVAHRWAYTKFIGPIPDGLVIDHLCQNPTCTNPGHLEAVTMLENLIRGNGFAARNRRKTHCKHGHPFSPENTKIEPKNKNGRRCLTCVKVYQDRTYQKNGSRWNANDRERRRLKAEQEGREFYSPYSRERPHGTRGRYRQGCRCEPCSTASHEYHKSVYYKAKAREQDHR